MSAPTLRALSRAFASGALDRAAYRRQRRELLQKIVEGTAPLETFVMPEPEARTVFPHADDDGDTTQEIMAPLNASVPGSAGGSRRSAAPWAVAIGAIALAGVGWFAWQQMSDNAPDSVPAPVGPSAAAPADLIESFLTANSWQAAALDELRRGWDGLDATQQAMLRQAPAMRRMEEQVLAQIQAQNALLNLGDAEEALATQAQLLDVMERFGVTSDRLARARAAWRDASTVHAARRVAAAAPAAAAPTPPAEPATPSETAAPTAAPASPPPPAAPVSAPVAAVPVAPVSAAPVAPAASAQAAKTIAPAATAAAATVAATASTAPGETATAKPRGGKRGNCKADLAKTRKPFCMDLVGDGVKGPPLVVLPAGGFEMGGEQVDEQPRHTVTLERPFAIGMFEVSAGELSAFCSATGTTCPAQPWESNPALPAVNVPWSLANAYAAWLSKSTGAQYRLPTEAEWEYAARAGSTGPTPFGTELLPVHARYSFKNLETTPLAANDRSVNANEFRLYHMLGNVREWVQDVWAAGYGGASADGSARTGSADAQHVARGGSYADRANAVRSAARVAVAATGDRYTGFRVVRVID